MGDDHKLIFLVEWGRGDLFLEESRYKVMGGKKIVIPASL